MREVYDAPAVLVIGNDPTEQHPLLAWQIRNNVRLHTLAAVPDQLPNPSSWESSCRLHADPVGRGRQSRAFLSGDDAAADAVVNRQDQSRCWTALRDKLRSEQNLVIIRSRFAAPTLQLW